MTEFVSEQKPIPYSQKQVYDTLSDLSNLEKFKDKIPQDKITNLTFDAVSCSFSAPMVGNVRFVLVEKIPDTTIRFAAEQLPVNVSMLIQLEAAGEEETQLKLTIEAELTPFLKPMVSGHLQKLADRTADVLAMIPY